MIGKASGWQPCKLSLPTRATGRVNLPAAIACCWLGFIARSADRRRQAIGDQFRSIHYAMLEAHNGVIARLRVNFVHEHRIICDQRPLSTLSRLFLPPALFKDSLRRRRRYARSTHLNMMASSGSPPTLPVDDTELTLPFPRLRSYRRR